MIEQTYSGKYMMLYACYLVTYCNYFLSNITYIQKALEELVECCITYLKD